MAVAATVVPTTYPSARIGRGNYVTVGSNGGLNYYLIAGITSVAADGTYTLTANLTPTGKLSTWITSSMTAHRFTGIVQRRALAAGCHSLLPSRTVHDFSGYSKTSGECAVGDTGRYRSYRYV